jgi:hypothetical protein
MEKSIEAPFVIVVSRKTRNGGRRGVKTEVSRAVAARMIVDGKVDLEKS